MRDKCQIPTCFLREPEDGTPVHFFLVDMLKVPPFSEKNKSFVLSIITFQLLFESFVHFESKFNSLILFCERICLPNSVTTRYSLLSSSMWTNHDTDQGSTTVKAYSR